MNRVSLLLFSIVFALPLLGSSATNRSVAYQPMTWTRLTNTLQIDSHWSLFAEADNRIFDRPLKESQALVRLMARYGFKSGITIGAGIVGSFNFPGDPNST